MLFRKAILIIHGFAGGIYDQEELANYLELNKHFDVFQFTLPGHERNFSKVNYEEWITASELKIEWLISKGYTSIYLIGHSMGGVIATYIAGKHKEVKKLVLAAPAFNYLNVEKENLNLTKSLKTGIGVIKTYSLEEVVARMVKFNASAIKEFMNLIKKYYNTPSFVHCKTLLLQGTSDNLVPVTSSKYVYNTLKSKIKKLVLIKNVNHDVFRNDRKLEIFKLVEQFLKEHNTKGGIYNI